MIPAILTLEHVPTSRGRWSPRLIGTCLLSTQIIERGCLRQSHSIQPLPLSYARASISSRDSSQAQHPGSISSLREVEGGCATVLLLGEIGD